jgi:CheY-specific phosphatase CheX
MTPASHGPDLSHIGESAFTQVLNTLLPLSSTSGNRDTYTALSDANDPITSTVLLAGPTLSGNVQVQLPKGFVKYATQLLTGIDGASADTNGLLDDTAGELANMVAGRVATRLAEDGYPCTLGTPSVFRSSPPPIEPQAGVERGRADLICEGHRLAVEIQCRYAAP